MFGGFAMLLWIGAVLSFIGYTVETMTEPYATKDQLYIGWYNTLYAPSKRFWLFMFQELF